MMDSISFFLAEKIQNIFVPNILIICGTDRDIPKIKKELDLCKIKYDLVFPNVVKGKLSDLEIPQ